MDNLLLKDIFDINDLNKLGPDYSPVNLYMRMQIRRALVKDTQFHGVNKCNILQRRSIRKTKDSYSKLNKEIVKLRNSFYNINLKNQFLFNSTKCESYLRDVNILNRNHNETFQDPYIFIDGLTTHKVDNLIIKNDKDFKLNTKAKPMKIETNQNETNKTLLVDCASEKSDDEVRTNIIKIDCTYVDKEIACETNEPLEDNDVSTDEQNQKAFHTTVCDLQSLLSMITLSSKTKHEESNYDHKTDLINENQSKVTEQSTVSHTIYYDIPKDVHISELLNVKQIFIEMNDSQKNMMKKYIDKWKKYVHKKQEIIKQQRQNALTTFFDKLQKKKANVNQLPDPVSKAKALARDYSTYQHRYKVQKHVIALQKAKLEEQHRLIEELKYNKIIEASRQSVDAMREEVRKTYYEIDRQLKPKIKCLTNELKIPEIDESTLVLQCLKVPQFLQRMEKRAREREEKHAMIRERRRQMEEERLRLKQQAELAKAEMDKDEKMRRIKELREKRKKERIDNIRKKQFAERMRALIVMADLHYEKYLLAKYGIKPLKMLLEIKQDNLEKAKTLYMFQLKKNMFLHLMWYTEDMVFERNYKAEEFHRMKVLHKAFYGVKQNHRGYVIKKQVADDYYDLYVTQLVFRKFREAMEIIKTENQIKWEAVVNYYNSNLMFRIFTCWRTLPALNALQREQEARKARWRTKVLQVVPDYTPPDD